jgi:hypothetical protein
MVREDQKPARAIPWSDWVMAGFFGWVISKTLDFMWKKFEARVKFEGKIHLDFYIAQAFLGFLGIFAYATIYNIIYTQRQRTSFDPKMFKRYQLALKDALRIHKSRHIDGFIKKEPCEICWMLNENRNLLQRFVPDAKYYPPFSKGNLK